jgi:hypothetical protein
MTPSTIHHDAEAISFDDLRSLAVAKSPCITAAVAIPDPLQLRARLQNAICSVEMQLKETGVIQTAPGNGRSSGAAFLGFFHSQIVGHRKYARKPVRADTRYGFVHLIGNYPY